MVILLLNMYHLLSVSVLSLHLVLGFEKQLTLQTEAIAISIYLSCWLVYRERNCEGNLMNCTRRCQQLAPTNITINKATILKSNYKHN